jgi:hypothetical protein
MLMVYTWNDGGQWFFMQCEEFRPWDSSAMMIRASHGMHAHYASKGAQMFTVGDSRAREVVFNSLKQPGVDFVPWVTRTQNAYCSGAKY